MATAAIAVAIPILAFGKSTVGALLASCALTGCADPADVLRNLPFAEDLRRLRVNAGFSGLVSGVAARRLWRRHRPGSMPLRMPWTVWRRCCESSNSGVDFRSHIRCRTLPYSPVSLSDKPGRRYLLPPNPRKRPQGDAHVIQVSGGARSPKGRRPAGRNHRCGTAD